MGNNAEKYAQKNIDDAMYDGLKTDFKSEKGRMVDAYNDIFTGAVTASTCKFLLCAKAQGENMSDASEKNFNEMIENICKHTPAGCVISICIEDGSAWVELHEDRKPEKTPLPDSADKTMLEQLNDALAVANGWSA